MHSDRSHGSRLKPAPEWRERRLSVPSFAHHSQLALRNDFQAPDLLSGLGSDSRINSPRSRHSLSPSPTIMATACVTDRKSSSPSPPPTPLSATGGLSKMATISLPSPSSPQARRSSVLVRKGSSQSCPMKEAELDELFNVTRKLGCGRFGVLYMAEDRQSKTQISVKIFNKLVVKQVDFIREYNYSYFLSPHPNIVDTYEGVYSSSDSYYFTQELSPCGTLREMVQTGLPDAIGQGIITQVVSALEFMHNEGLVHRNLRAENILVFNAAFTKIKLTDFGLTRKQGTLVKHLDTPNAYHAPELCDTLLNEAYSVDRSVDIWALGVLIFFVMRARYPWTKASIMCKPYWEWEQWLKRKTPSLPPKWTRFTEISLKLLKKTLNPKWKDRCTVKDVRKLIKGKWLKEVKSMSEDVLFLHDDAGDLTKISHSMADIAGTDRRLKRRSVLQQWLAATISTMTEISEQVVSATE